ncbi:MAG: hypothetical protein SNG27_02330 [Rikenellaceae bacterium]
MQHQTPLKSLGATVAFVVTALIASILLISSFVFFLGEIIGSHLLSMVIVGGVCAIVSWAIYSISLKPIIREWEEQLTTIYEVANAARKAYEWCVEYLITKLFKGI